MSSQQRKIPFYARDLWIAGLVGLPLGHWFLFAQIEPFYSGIYTFLWWPFIFVMDFLVYRLRHESLLQDRPREFLLLTLWSTPIWLLFELFNFRLKNWTYIQVPFLWSDLSSWFMIPAYATVLPALFEGADLFSALIGKMTNGRGVQGRAFQVRSRHVKIQMAVGGAMLVLPMIWPDLFFCLIWGFAFFFFDPLCYRRQGTSLLGQLAKGHETRLAALLLSGLLCGGLWEGWNIAARSKWLYTVPGFDDLKLFEMPVLGFLGFPPFALECYALVNVINLFRGGRSWERRGLDNLRVQGMRPRVALWGWTATIVFSCLVFEGIFLWSVTSYSTPLDYLFGPQLSRRERLILWNEDVRFPHQFLARWGQATPESETEEKISTVLPHGFDPETFSRLRALSTLSELKGIGLYHAVTLEAVGVRTPVDLAREAPDVLVERMRQEVQADLVPSEAVARVWIVAAKKWARCYAPGALSTDDSEQWGMFLDDEMTSGSEAADDPFDLDRETEASSRTQSPTLPQAVHPTESTTQPQELTLLPTTATKTLQPTLATKETSVTKDGMETKTTSETVEKKTEPEMTTATQTVKPEESSKSNESQESKTEPQKVKEEQRQPQTEPQTTPKETSATEAAKLDGETKKTSETQTMQSAGEAKKTSETQTAKPEEKPREEVKKPEEKPKEEAKKSEEKPEEKPKAEAKKPEEKQKEEPQKAQKTQKETSATEPAKPASEGKKTSETQTSKPEEKPREEVKKPEEKPKEEAKKPEEKPEEKPKAEAKKPEEKPKEEPQKVQKTQKETSAAEPAKSASEGKKTSETQTAKPEEKVEEKARVEAKKFEEKPKEEAKNLEEARKEEAKKSKKP
jgi:hypothetical protein